MYARPGSLDQALGWLSEGGARVMAGMTDILPAAGESPLQGRFVDVSDLSELRGVSFDGAQFRIGGATTWSEIARADLPPAFVALKRAAREVGSVQIQNRGTIAGNLCNASPAADGAPALLILNASVELASTRGLRRLALGDFISGSRRTALEGDEILTAVVVPSPSPLLRSAFLKLGARRYLVISIAMVAAALEIDDGVVRDARIAIGACSAVAKRMARVERRLVGRRAAPGLGAAPTPEDFAGLAPIDDVRASAPYRLEAARTLVARAIEACIAGEAGGAV